MSRRIRALEDAIGVSIFHRESQGAKPTLAGQSFMQAGEAILADLNVLLRRAALSGSGAEGRLCVGIVSSIAGGTAHQLLQAFVSTYPAVELIVVQGASNDHIASIRSLDMDVSFIVDSPYAPGCEIESLWSEPILVALPVDHPFGSADTVRWDQLVGERFIVSHADPGPEIHDFVVRSLSDLGRRPIVEPRPVQREGLIAMVGLGRGISLVGAAEAAVCYPGVVFRILEGEMLPFSAVWSAKNDNPALRRFLSLARLQVRTFVRQTGRSFGGHKSSGGETA